MTYFEMVNRRQSCRSYDPARPVEQEKLARCLEAARLAPSACNSQPWRFTAVTGGEALSALRESVQGQGMNKFASDSPVMVVVSEERPNATEALGQRVKKQDFVSIDIGLATSQFCYQALEEGLSTCILGWFDEPKVKQIIGLSEQKRVRLVLTLGYAKEGDTIREKKRKALEKMGEIR